MTEKFRIGKPGPSKAGFSKDDHEGHLLAFVGVSYEPDVSTSNGVNDAARVETIVCLDDDTVVFDQLIFGTVLVPRLCGAVEAEIIVARLVKGTAKPGRSAPWLLEEPLPVDEVKAAAWFEANASRLPPDPAHPSGRIAVGAPTPEHAVESPF